LGKGPEDSGRPNLDNPARSPGNVQRLGADDVVPEAVEVGPVVADHLGAGVFGMDVGGRDVLGPAGHERGRRPVSNRQAGAEESRRIPSIAAEITPQSPVSIVAGFEESLRGGSLDERSGAAMA